MAILQQHADAIVRGAPPERVHQKYPRHMTHPAYTPGSIGTEVKSPGGFTYHVGGTPIRYAPVLVMDEGQEEYYKSQGYVTQGESDPAAFAAAVATMRPAGEEYEPQEYPKWVGGKLVQNAEEEARAARERRVQLGIEEPAEKPGDDPTPKEPPPQESTPPAPEKTTPPDEPEPQPAAAQSAVTERIAALEGSLSEIKLMLRALTRSAAEADQPVQVLAAQGPGPQSAPVAPPWDEPAGANEPTDVTAEKPPEIAEKPPEKTAKPEKNAVAAHDKPIKQRKARPPSKRKMEEQHRAQDAARRVAAVMHPSHAH
jgi:hypothetical protein